MRPCTRNRSFLSEAVFGFAVSLIAAAIALALSYLLPGAIVARLAVTGIGLAVVVRALARSDEKTGRVVTLVAWLVATVGVWLAGVGLATLIIVQLISAWLVRSLFTYSRFIEAGVDLGLVLLAVCFAIFAAIRTESVFLATWSYLLVQAMHVAIPGMVSRWMAPRATKTQMAFGDPNRGFADAFKAADEALHRIAGQRLG